MKEACFTQGKKVCDERGAESVEVQMCGNGSFAKGEEGRNGMGGGPREKERERNRVTVSDGSRERKSKDEEQKKEGKEQSTC